MNAKDYYEEMRKAGLTDDITSNDEPDYKLPFYQSIFRLMEGFAQQRKNTLVTQFEDATNSASNQTEVMGSVFLVYNSNGRVIAACSNYKKAEEIIRSEFGEFDPSVGIEEIMVDVKYCL